MEPAKKIFDFTRPQDAQNWYLVDDVVMGGVSSSRAEVLPADTVGRLVFPGEVSLDNHDGFDSIRTRAERVDLSNYAGLSLRVRGDEKPYQFRLRDNTNFDGVTYQPGLKRPWENGR